jgi:hypothetical protein
MQSSKHYRIGTSGLDNEREYKAAERNTAAGSIIIDPSLLAPG